MITINRLYKDSSRTVLVWDGFVRVFHWSIVSGFLLNRFIVEDNNALHNWIGYFVLAMILLRLLWGFTGSHYAKFRNFVPGMKSLITYLIDLVNFRERDYQGHNPAGAVMIIMLILLMMTICISGWMMGLDKFWGEDWVEDLHYYGSSGMLYLMSVHAAGVFYASFRHKQNLVVSMVTGRKSRQRENYSTRSENQSLPVNHTG